MISIAVILMIAHLVGVSAPTALSSDEAPRNALKKPVEFLYLDATRVASYLAQIEDGAREDEKVTSKVTTTR